MRIIAGTHRGTSLADVGAGDEAAHLRPTPDRVREAVFSSLMSRAFGDPVTGARVLDLFAGTGALGLEALSRGAVQATFVDNGHTAQRLIRANIAKLRREADTALLTCDVDDLPTAPEPASLIFLDPPYGQGAGAPALVRAQARGWIAPAALIVWEDSTPQPPPAGFTKLSQKKYGETWITILRAA